MNVFISYGNNLSYPTPTLWETLLILTKFILVKYNILKWISWHYLVVNICDFFRLLSFYALHMCYYQCDNKPYTGLQLLCTGTFLISLTNRQIQSTPERKKVRDNIIWTTKCKICWMQYLEYPSNLNLLILVNSIKIVTLWKLEMLSR